MRDRVKPSEGLESFHAPSLSPAEGLEAASSLFTSPPIEALEMLHELGDIAAASFREAEAFMGTEEIPAEIPIGLPAAPPVSAPPTRAALPKAPKTADERLMEALLEYHRLRGPKLGARTAPRPSAGSGERFASVEIPVIQDAVPKTPATGNRASRPMQTILKPKTKP